MGAIHEQDFVLILPLSTKAADSQSKKGQTSFLFLVRRCQSICAFANYHALLGLHYLGLSTVTACPPTFASDMDLFYLNNSGVKHRA